MGWLISTLAFDHEENKLTSGGIQASYADAAIDTVALT